MSRVCCDAGHSPKGLIVVGSDGIISLAALRWLADQGAAFVLLERDGSVLAATGPVRTSDARLRRSQALSIQTGAVLKIAKTLIAQKLAGQESLVRDKLKNQVTADMIARFRSPLDSADELVSVRKFTVHSSTSFSTTRTSF